MKQVEHLHPAPDCATCARKRNQTRAYFCAKNARERRRKRETRSKEEQEAGVFRDVACAVYANWARVNARNARDGI